MFPSPLNQSSLFTFICSVIPLSLKHSEVVDISHGLAKMTDFQTDDALHDMELTVVSINEVVICIVLDS
jgi:hypothetical protein